MKVFVNKEIEIIKGTQAASLIDDKNEMQYFEEGIGIRNIDRDRWLEAQYYERKTWCGSPSRGMITDRNEDHKRNFDNYKLLPSILKDDLSVIELGCGPFTNLRFILPSTEKRIASVSLLDPLIDDYILNSPNCTYKDGTLGAYPVTTFSTPIEEFEPSQKYDLVVMINVLDHCFDIDMVFKKISGMLKDGGIFLIGECVYKEGLKQSLENVYDAGHPIRMTEEYFNSKVNPFKSLYHKEIVLANIINKYLILQK